MTFSRYHIICSSIEGLCEIKQWDKYDTFQSFKSFHLQKTNSSLTLLFKLSLETSVHTVLSPSLILAALLLGIDFD